MRWSSSVKTDIDKVLKSGEDGGGSEDLVMTAKDTVFKDIDIAYEPVAPLVNAWMVDAQGQINKGLDADSFNGEQFLRYLNWVEDTESAVRVYIKTTNRETFKQPSNAVMAPRSNLTNDSRRKKSSPIERFVWQNVTKKQSGFKRLMIMVGMIAQTSETGKKIKLVYLDHFTVSTPPQTTQVWD